MPQGSFPRVCDVVNRIRSDLGRVRDHHASYRQFFQRESDLYHYVSGFPVMLRHGVGKHTFSKIRDLNAVYTVLGAVSYMKRAERCAESVRIFEEGNLARMDQLLGSLTREMSAFLYQDIFNIRVSALNAQTMLDVVRELRGRVEMIHQRAFEPAGSGRTIFEPCHTFEAAVDIFFRPLVPELVKRWNRYENPRTFDPFWGGRETNEAVSTPEIAKLRYEIWRAAGAAWTLETVLQTQQTLYRNLAADLEKYAWEVKVFQRKSRYDAFFCRLPRNSL